MLKTSKAEEEEEEAKNGGPQIHPDGYWLWRCFAMLNAQRQSGANGPQPIAIADIAGLAVIDDLDAADTTWMAEIVIVLDRIWIEEIYKQIKKQQEDASKKAKNQSKRGTR